MPAFNFVCFTVHSVKTKRENSLWHIVFFLNPIFFPSFKHRIRAPVFFFVFAFVIFVSFLIFGNEKKKTVWNWMITPAKCVALWTNNFRLYSRYMCVCAGTGCVSFRSYLPNGWKRKYNLTQSLRCRHWFFVCERVKNRTFAGLSHCSMSHVETVTLCVCVSITMCDVNLKRTENEGSDSQFDGTVQHWIALKTKIKWIL